MIKRKRVLAASLVAVLGLTAAACGSDEGSADTTDTTSAVTDETAAPETTEAMTEDTTADTAAPETTEAMTEETTGDVVDGSAIKACEVTDTGGVDDKGFNQIAYEGAQRAATDFGSTAEVLESKSDADYAVNIQSFIEQECDVIITVGFLLGDATAEAATNNPDQQFAIIDFGYEEPIPNVRTLNFDAAQPSFLAGYLAAGMTESGTVATYGGINIPPVTVFMDGFVNGVAYYNEQKGTDVKVLGWDGSDGVFAGNFENLDDGKAIATSFADEGADIIFPVAGPVGLGSSAYAAETGGIRIIGVDTDLFVSNPNQGSVYLTSVLKNMDEAVYDTIKNVVESGVGGDAYVGTLENNGVGLAEYHDQDGDVPQELKDEIEALRTAIIDGSVTIG